jgi:hypothetical protein
MPTLRTIMVICVVSIVSARAHAANELRNMDEVGAAIRACWKSPAGSQGSSVTLSFSFRRDGMLSGPPQPTAIDVPGDNEARSKFVGSAITALERCTPLHLAPALGGDIAGLVFTMPFPASKQH